MLWKAVNVTGGGQKLRLELRINLAEPPGGTHWIKGNTLSAKLYKMPAWDTFPCPVKLNWIYNTVSLPFIKRAFKGTIYQSYMGCPRNHPRLRYTIYLFNEWQEYCIMVYIYFRRQGYGIMVYIYRISGQRLAKILYNDMHLLDIWSTRGKDMV